MIARIRVPLVTVALLVAFTLAGQGGQASTSGSAPAALATPYYLATVSVGTGDGNTGPEGVGIDRVANRIFVANTKENKIYVVDGGTHSVSTVADPSALVNFTNSWGSGIGVNTVTRKVYVANSARHSLLVINADTLAITNEMTGLGHGPTGVAVDEVANRIYVTNFGDGDSNDDTVSVINGSTEMVVATVHLDGRGFPFGIALDTSRSRAYITHRFGDAGDIQRYVSVLDTASLSHWSYAEYSMNQPSGIAVRSVGDGRAFVSIKYNWSSGAPALGIFNYLLGDAGKLVTWGTGMVLPFGNPIGVAYNPTSDRVFVNSYDAGQVMVVDADKTYNDFSVLVSLPVGSNPDFGIGVNPNTSRVYVANRGSGTLTVIQDASGTPPTNTPTPTRTPTATPTSTPTPQVCTMDAYEPDDTAAQAKRIMSTFGYTQTHTFCFPQNPSSWYLDSDWVRFQASGVLTTPRVFTVTTSNASAGAVPFLALYGPGTPVSTSVALASGSGQITYALAAGLDYFVHVTNLSPSQLAAIQAGQLPAPSLPQAAAARNYDLAILGGLPLSNKTYLPLIFRAY